MVLAVFRVGKNVDYFSESSLSVRDPSHPFHDDRNSDILSLL